MLFWPTIPITISRRIGKWTTVVDNAVVIGGAPFGFLDYPAKLKKQFDVRGVVNMCDEYQGPISSYKKLGIEHLRLPTVDHFEPSVEDLKRAVSFIQKHEAQGGRVYVHCRAGHGRSAAAVYAWLLYKEPLADPVELNEKLCSMRNVRKSLWKQPNVNAFRVWLQDGGMMDDTSDDEGEGIYTKRKKLKRHRQGHPLRPYHATERSSRYLTTVRRRNTERYHEPDGHPPVFSDEEDSTTDVDISDNDEVYDEDGYGAVSDDERDYEMWRKYSKRE